MFVGRQQELASLGRAWNAGKFAMFVVYGRRRVGKSTLLRRFSQGKRTLYFTAKRQSDKNNLEDFSRAVWEFAQQDASMPAFDSWDSAIGYVMRLADSERMVFVFDELPYAAERNPSLLSTLQIAIDEHRDQSGMFMLLCGSSQGFMESQVLGEKSPIYGRRTGQLKLRPLDYLTSAEMLPAAAPLDAFRYYACLGGIPYYLEQIDGGQSFEDNIRRLYFEPTGVLFAEPGMLLREELREVSIYNSVIGAVARGRNKVTEIADAVGVERTSLSAYLATLSELGVICKIVPFGESSAGRRGLYAVDDALYGFWFRFVSRYTEEIEAGAGDPAFASMFHPGAVEDYLGHRFEKVCSEWLMRQLAAGGLPFAAKKVGTWWGNDPVARREADIDVLAADPEEHRLLIGECKYRESFDESAVLADLMAKHALIPGWGASWFYVFSKHAVSAATLQKHADDASVRFVSLEEMYR